MSIFLKDLISESSYDKGLFKAMFMSGIPGSGKSYVLSKITDGSIEPRIVNTDKMIEYYSKQLDVDINAEQYFDLFKDSVKRITLNQLALYINSLLPLFIDGTSNSLKSLFKREGILKSFGYDTGMVWIETSLDVAIARAEKRNREVPADFIKKVYDNLSKNKEYYRSHFAFFKEIKNDDGELNNTTVLDAYKATSGFFNSPVKNPIGIENIEVARKSSAYLVPRIYRSIDDIQRGLSGWYGNY